MKGREGMEGEGLGRGGEGKRGGGGSAGEGRGGEGPPMTLWHGAPNVLIRP